MGSTTKHFKKIFYKTIDFLCGLWYNISVKGRGAVRQTLNSGIPVGVTADRPHRDRLGNRREVANRRATADTNSRLGVAVGILNNEDCGDAGNP